MSTLSVVLPGVVATGAVVREKGGRGGVTHVTTTRPRPECQIIQPNYKDTTTHNIRASLVPSRPQVNMVNIT